MTGDDDDKEWLQWKALASVVALPMGFGATLGMLFFFSQFWSYDPNATLQAVSTMLGAGLAFLGISWQVRAGFKAQESVRKQARLDRISDLARPLAEEIELNLQILAVIREEGDALRRATFASELLAQKLINTYTFERLQHDLHFLEDHPLAAKVRVFYRVHSALLIQSELGNQIDLQEALSINSSIETLARTGDAVVELLRCKVIEYK
jgi:hypothetical protein